MASLSATTSCVVLDSHLKSVEDLASPKSLGITRIGDDIDLARFYLERMDTDSYNLWRSQDRRYTLSHRTASARTTVGSTTAPQSPKQQLSAKEAEHINMLMTELARRLEDSRA